MSHVKYNIKKKKTKPKNILINNNNKKLSIKSFKLDEFNLEHQYDVISS